MIDYTNIQMPSEEIITISKEYIQAIKAKKNEPPRLKEAEDLAQEAHDYFLAKINSAKSDEEYITGITGLRVYGGYKKIIWMFNDEDEEKPTLGDFIAELEGHFGKHIESQVKALRLLRQKMANISIPDDKNIAVVVKNSDVEPGIESGYYVLASLSKDQETITDKIFTDKDRTTGDDGRLIFIYTNHTACVEHACSTAHKTISDLGPGVLQLNIINRLSLDTNLVRDKGGVAQFVIGKDDQGKSITQDLENYMLCALALGIDDRVVRMSVPESYQ